ncbi:MULTISPECIES: hypothetical protein [Francisella]|uniref:Uncharacterized protein n=1 Tax=Francisella opportunistica TaxID=2016517 RepID=A0A345JRJ5_9GAMM|nr:MULTISPECIES: hypothetical protein [Francisella]APC91673.1 hypothetical protein BBG19_0937 [Francisella sp. MA067296]AXH29941.1 hypothetical protein CGC43_04770 [Francisella opportunistica]AXH31588.1 hypothetical protein CGC44_04730 [Francisella opportunistica]AXH33236.1 hypothetical protein CGC45_04755 [Francisella opportunistica]
MLFKNKKSTDTLELENNDQDTTSTIIKPKLWKLFNWLIFCAFILVLSSYLNARIFLIAFTFVILVALAIKLYLLNKLPPLNFRIYIVVFLLIFILCEYNHLEIVYFKSFKISNIDYQHLLTNPGIFVGALCNIVFTTKIQIAPQLFFNEDFIQWAASYIDKTPQKALIYLDGVYFAIFGYIVPVIINFIYAMLIAVIAVRIKQLIIRS